ncbi:MAG: GSCFA domain-containing protein [Bacteroidales bacterium]|nr:GSCFA domain-containing protein [Bacteroidales bacterium]
MKFFTRISIEPLGKPFSLSDRIMILGSCFADSIGGKMSAAGFDVCVNPFGTLYNPESLAEAVRLLDSDRLFGPSDCVPMGAGAGRICSFRHHTSFARETAEEFLSNANAKLQQAREFWSSANRLVLTLGTSFAWYHNGSVVANCLKRPAGEFTRRMLSVEESAGCLSAIASAHPGKDLLVTVSPIRHLGDGAHANAVSKARLLLAADAITGFAGPGCAPSDFGPYEQERGAHPGSAATVAYYFPAYEIMMDELRDYRFYADDLFHPSTAAVDYIWERFLESCVSPSDLDRIARNEKAARQSAHRPNLV